MTSRRLSLWLSGAGVVLLIPGIVWIATSGSRLNDDDAFIALQPLVRIPLARISDGNFSEPLPIPETAQWVNIRKVWGEPEFVISTIDEAGRDAMCLPSIGLRIEVRNQTGSLMPLWPGGAPYGYSDFCSESSMRFRAAPGDMLALTITSQSGRALPAGYLIVVGNWWNTKDRLVSVSLDKDTKTFVQWISLTGVALVLAGAVLMFRHHVRQHQPN
jgi:hypothetical protein